MRGYSHAELLALTPDSYLEAGFDGPELTGTHATAAAYQLLDGEVAPQELSFTATALDQVLGLHEGAPADRLAAALPEALALVERMIGQSNNERLLEWLWECANHIREAGIFQPCRPISQP